MKTFDTNELEAESYIEWKTIESENCTEKYWANWRYEKTVFPSPENLIFSDHYCWVNHHNEWIVTDWKYYVFLEINLKASLAFWLLDEFLEGYFEFLPCPALSSPTFPLEIPFSTREKPIITFAPSFQDKKNKFTSIRNCKTVPDDSALACVVEKA